MGMIADIPKAVEGFRGFDQWAHVVAWVELEESVYYQAPLDLMPRRVSAKRRGDEIRVQPLYGKDFDPFMADEGHLSRFYVVDQAPSSDIDPPEPPTLRETGK
jgi:hypothetical protein